MLNDLTDVVGKKHTLPGLTSGLFIPLSIREVSETIAARGVPKGTAISMMALFGMSVGTYGRRTGYIAADKEERAKILAKDIKRADRDSGPLPYADMLTPAMLRRYNRARKHKRKVKKTKK
jgi:hypothetical protein